MFEPDDQVYYENRAVHAMALGNQAADSKIAAVHFELALRYSLLSAQPPRTRPDLLATSGDGEDSRPMFLQPAPDISLEPDREYALG